MRFALGMRTTDRTPIGARNYAMETLGNFARSGGFRSSHLVGFGIACSTWEFGHVDMRQFCAATENERGGLVTPETAGMRWTPNVTAWKALALAHLMAERRGGADWIFHLEDDLDFCSRFLESVEAWIEDEVRPTDRLITFATLKKTVDEMNGARSFVRPVTSFHGSQCYAVRAEDVPSLIAYLEAHPQYRGVDKCHDLLLHGWLAEVGGEIRSTNPSFVDHIGLESFLSPGSRHVITGFPGREWKYQRKRG